MLETAAHANLPAGIVVNHSYETPKTGRMSSILVNTTSRNIWIRQPLLATGIYKVELHPWQYRANLNRGGNDINIHFQLIIPPEIDHDLQSNQVEAEVKINNLWSSREQSSKVWASSWYQSKLFWRWSAVTATYI